MFYLRNDSSIMFLSKIFTEIIYADHYTRRSWGISPLIPSPLKLKFWPIGTNWSFWALEGLTNPHTNQHAPAPPPPPSTSSLALSSLWLNPLFREFYFTSIFEIQPKIGPYRLPTHRHGAYSNFFSIILSYFRIEI